MNDIAAPLTEQHLALIDTALRKVYDLEQLIPRFCAAGVDCSAQQTQLAAYKAQLTAMRQQFFPGR